MRQVSTRGARVLRKDSCAGVACHKKNEIIVFDNVKGYREEKETYSRKLDANGSPLEEIENKHDFHRMDAERYIISWIKRKGFKMKYDTVDFYHPPTKKVEVEPYRSEAEIEKMLERADQ